MASIAHEEDDDGTSPPERQPTSLLSLPDELLVRIFDHLAVRLWKGVHPLWPLTHVCRRVRSVAQEALYRDVVIGPYRNKTPHFQEAVEENPPLGQLVETLTIGGTGYDPAGSKSAVLGRESRPATIGAVSNLKESTLSVTIDEACALLAALPSPLPSLRALNMRLAQTPSSVRWTDLWTHLSRLSELRVVRCNAWPVFTTPRQTAHATQHIPIPQLVTLHITDYILTETFENAGPLHQTLPSLRELHVAVSRSDNVSAVSAILAEAPSSLTTLNMVSNFEVPGTPSRYLPALPPLRHLELGPRTFIEADLLAFLPMAATLESIRFDFSASVTDCLLRALTGPGRPPQLRQICLDHVKGASPEQIAEDFKLNGSLSPHMYTDWLRGTLGPYWPEGGTARGLRLALATAKANGIEVTGSALACADWDSTFDKVLADAMMEQANETDAYGDVIARSGEEVATARLEEYASSTD